MKNLVSPLATVEFFKRGQNVQITQNFHLREFECKCKMCPYTLISIDHIIRLQELRNLISVPITILSAYRCPRHNENVGGEKYSMHQYGLATDICTEAFDSSTLVKRCRAFDGIGVYDTFVHVDSRGFTAFWDKRSK